MSVEVEYSAILGSLTKFLGLSSDSNTEQQESAEER